ncbi:FAD-dependent monooxygenase [Streptomyces avicenniae]|uniref:FAD-dependent monooxygenase n=1 Tax=Streptomyces avicenniae TaxID=500153 RepID=UPI00069A6E34|nr:FAD-dependent monooxygenase [Streptomyces avicenniae]
MAGRTAVVVGGGPGGLASAVALVRRGWRVRVLERDTDRADSGAGLSLWPNALRALDSLGLASRVHARGAVERRGTLRDRAGRRLAMTDNAEIERRYGWPLLVLHRRDLLRVLGEALPPGVLLTGGAVRETHADADGVVVTHDGGTCRADLVVAADGLHSAVRRQWWPQGREPRYAGHTAWRMSTEPLAEPPSEGAATWGRGERFGFTALPGGRVYCFATATAPPGGATGDPRAELAEVRRRFGHWPGPVPALLDRVPAARVLRHDVYDLPPLPTFTRGRIALLGDAAHAMTPSLGQGACQALEDAVTLAACLGGGEDIDGALARYDRLRRPRTQAVVRRSARLSGVGQWAWPPAAHARDLAARLTPAAATLRSMDTVLGWSPTAVV